MIAAHAHAPTSRSPQQLFIRCFATLLGLVLVGSLLAAVPVTASFGASAIQNKYAQLGGSGGRLGAPLTRETCGLAQGGCYQQFQGGHIHWTPTTGAHPTWGAIRTKWQATDWERGVMGYPTTDERCGLVGGGCFQKFQKGSIYYSPAAGAHWVRGAFLTAWGNLTWERGVLGYPTSDESCNSTTCTQTFQQGKATYTKSTGAAVITNSRLGANTPVYSNKWSACTPTLAGHAVSVARTQRTVTIVDQTSKTGATLSTLTRTNSACGFIRVVYATGARLGYGGTVWWSDRKQNTGTTPRGSFLMTESFGNGSAPPTEMPYHVTTNADYWALDQQSTLANYNERRTLSQGGFRTSEAEHLRDYTTQYRHSVVIDFNRKSNPKVMGRGGGIFLHVHGSGATAGCVSITLTELQTVMRYLKSGDKIVITT